MKLTEPNCVAPAPAIVTELPLNETRPPIVQLFEAESAKTTSSPADSVASFVTLTVAPTASRMFPIEMSNSDVPEFTPD
ncbi:MAG TPA: hypothetical protein PLV92_24325, partial [Pirellulaceae bacterium]|nr:hypothetical protein [Pirellulaceae bacterium]